MSNKLTRPILKFTAISASLGLLLAVNSAQAVDIVIKKMEFYDAGGTPGFYGGGLNTSVNTSVIFNSAGNGAADSGPSPFFGTPWTAVQAMWNETAGAATWNGTSASGAYNYSYTLGSGEVAVGINFTWGSNTGIMVLQIFDCSNGITCTGVNNDATHSLVPGTAMVNGPFTGQHATFSGVVEANFDVILSGTQGGKNMVLATTTGGNATITPEISGASGTTSYSWSSSPTALASANVGGTTNSTLVFDPSGLTSGTTYTISLSTTITGQGTVIQTMPVTVIAPSLTATDTDGDGLNDNDASEGFADDDGDGIPNYLDPTNNSATLVAIDSNDTSKGNMSVSTGTLRLGAIAKNKSITSMMASGTISGTAVTISDIGTTDTAVTSNCTGGCFDFEVRGLTKGASTQVVIPLSAALPDYPVYRKFSTANTSWRGFLYDNNNYLSSAAALSTGPITCPAAGSSSYTKGLTPGNFCLQLTMTDGGPNDSDGFANGVLADPGGISSSSEEIMAADVPNGCSMSTVPVKLTERADWWLIAGFFVILGWLRSMRRKSHAA